MVIPADFAAVSILASPMAIKPRMDFTEEVPTLVDAPFSVAVKGALTSEYKNPVTGDETNAQLEKKTVTSKRAKNFFIVKHFNLLKI